MFHLFLFCSSSGTGDEARLVVCSSLPLLCSRDAHPGLQPVAGILPLPHAGIHGRSVWSQHRVHRPVRSHIHINFYTKTYINIFSSLTLVFSFPKGAVTIYRCWTFTLQDRQSQWDCGNQQVKTEMSFNHLNPGLLYGQLTVHYLSFFFSLPDLIVRTGSTKKP